MGEPTGGGGEVGGGGELRLPRTELIDREGEGARVEAVDSRAALASECRITTAIASLAFAGGGAEGSGRNEVRGMTGSVPRVPGASEEGPGRILPVSTPVPAPASDAGVLPEGFPVLGGGGFKSEGGASTAMATDCFPSDLRLRVLLRGFTGLAGIEEARW